MVSIQHRDSVALVTIANAPVNAVSGEVASDIAAALAEVTRDPAIAAIVLAGAGETFIAGADIKMLSAVVDGTISLPDLNSFLFAIEDSPKPVIAAIAGSALGGGLETAMAAHYRLAASNAVLGQPEVKLGLIPGMGGTQRLPRLIGAEKALEMCVTGRPITAEDALRCNLLDRIVEGDLVDAAIKFASSVPPVRRTRDRVCTANAALFSEWRERAKHTRRGEEAPLAAIEAIEAASAGSFDAGFAREQELFRERLHSSQAKAMLHVFFGERTVAKIPGLRAEAKPQQIRRAAVLGAGFMGSGISMVFANAGIPVRLTDVNQAVLERAVPTIEARCRNHALIDVRPGLEGFESADLIVEAVFEDISVKKETFHQIARVAAEGSILASNTSTFNIDELAQATGRPERFIGLHFFSPAHVMKLVEVVRGTQTSDEVIATAMALGKRLGKIAVLSRNQFGFIGNRMVLPYLREAHRLVEEGVSVEQINRALYDFGMPMGPLAMEDLVGLDITHDMRQEAMRRGRLEGSQPRIADLLYRSGRLGQKTRIGWSVYDEKRKPAPNPEIKDLLGGSQREVKDEEIVERCLGELVKEGRAVVAEGVALRPVDVDIVYIYGYGFPAWRGGPLFWADHRVSGK